MTIPEAATALGLAPSTLRGKGNYPHRVRPASERFWAKVTIGPECWTWTGAKHPKGYGNFAGEDCKPIAAHRFAFEQEHGPIPGFLHVLHTCDNPSCVKPSHLYLGTNADNIRDKMERNRQSSANRKLSAEDVGRIRSDLDRSASSFAREFGVSIEVVCRVRRGTSYRVER